MKKILITFLTMNIILFPHCFTNTANADNSYETIKENNTYTENEFVALNQKINNYKKTQKNAYNMMYYNELLENKNQYKEYIYQLKTKSTSELKEMNYNNSQIEAIHNYDGSDTLSAKAAATVQGTLSVPSFKYNSSTKKTNITAKYTVKWNGTPYFKYYDVMAIAVAGSEKKFMDNGSSFSCKKVTDMAGTKASKNVHIGAGVSYKFNIADKNNTATFSSATLTYKAVAGGKVTVAAVETRYAHWQVQASTSFGISTSGLNIGFTIGPAYNIENKKNKTVQKYI